MILVSELNVIEIVERGWFLFFKFSVFFGNRLSVRLVLQAHGLALRVLASIVGYLWDLSQFLQLVIASVAFLQNTLYCTLSL